MKYYFTTLAIGEEYEKNAISFFEDLNTKTEDCSFLITTTNTDLKYLEQKYNNFSINVINPIHTDDGRPGFNFNVNLKCLSLKHVIELEKEKNRTEENYQPKEFVFYVDSDWKMHQDFSEDKIKKILNYMSNEDKDFVFERPARIGDGRMDPENSFYRDKIYDYDIQHHNKWDEAHVCNEQILLFKINNKFRFFVQRWEQFLWYSVVNRIRNYAEGFEIGISALEANMNYNWFAFHLLNNCFYFYTKSGDLHIRF